MRLYLVQHGEAVSKDVDPERPLSEQGRQDVQAVAAFLGGSGVRVERVWHSGKRRAEQTASILAKKLLPGGKIEKTGGINPNDPVEAFAPDADVWEQDTLVAGHLPFMSRLVSLLTVGKPGHALVSYLPGSVVCLERHDSSQWGLLWMVRPDLLGGKD
jgi:phosphohistidine phosphatase